MGYPQEQCNWEAQLRLQSPGWEIPVPEQHPDKRAYQERESSK